MGINSHSFSGSSGWFLGLVFAFLLVSAPLLPPTACAEDFEHLATGAVFRDAVFASDGSRLYVTAYDRDEVWELDSCSGERLRRAPVGDGPVSVSLSPDGTTLATANSLAGSASFVSLVDFSPIATIPTGRGACDVVWLDSQTAAVANPFSDTVTLLDSGRVRQELSVRSLPTRLAVSQGFLAVATRLPNQVVLIDRGSWTPRRLVPLSGTPQCVVSGEGDRFIVGMDTATVVVSPDRQPSIAVLDEGARDLSVALGDVYALTGDAIVILDGTRVVDRQLAPQGATAIATSERLTVTLCPTDSACYKSGTCIGESEPAPDLETVPEPAPVAPPSPAPAKIDDSTGTPSTPSGPVAPDTSKQEVPKPPEVEAPSNKQTTEATAVVPDRGASSFTRLSETHTPKPTARPAAYPGQQESSRTISEALTTGLRLGFPKDAFAIPDWENVASRVSGDQLQASLDGNTVRAEGNAQLDLDNTLFSADSLVVDRAAGELHAVGNIVIRQGDTELHADEIRYTVPLGAELPEPAGVLFPVDQATLRTQAIGRGRLDASDLSLIDPLRTFSAEHLEYDFLTESGVANSVSGSADIYYFAAERLDIKADGALTGHNAWVTTCPLEHPHYRIRVKDVDFENNEFRTGHSVNLQLADLKTPIYWPRFSYTRIYDRRVSLDFDSGHDAALGYYANIGQRYPVSPDADLGIRLFPTSREGVGAGVEAYYDFMLTPASPLYRSKGSFESLYTTKSRGYAEFHHRQELRTDTVLLLQWEQWSDSEFYKDFFYEDFRHRTGPRTFGNLTYTQPDYIASATIRKNTHDFVRETERAPEASFHLLERQILPNVYFTFDTVNSYLERRQIEIHAARSVNAARLTADLNFHEALNLTPFYEVETTWYSDERNSDASDIRLSNTLGLTAQSRLVKAYPGAFGFSGFKHVIVPSMTYSYRPEPTMTVEETPRFDAYDNVYGRSRLETKIDNIILGRDAATSQVWPVGRLTLYHGNDFWNANTKSNDWEVELDLRPHPWWGLQTVGEHHGSDDDIDLDQPFFLQRTILQLLEEAGYDVDPSREYRYDVRYGDYNRILAFLYYDDTSTDGRLNGRLGFAYTETQGDVFNREVLYGLGYRLNDKWSVSFDHRYDFERDTLYRQTYEIQRIFHCWGTTLQFNERESGWDVGVEVFISAFPGTKLKF